MLLFSKTFVYPFFSRERLRYWNLKEAKLLVREVLLISCIHALHLITEVIVNMFLCHCVLVLMGPLGIVLSSSILLDNTCGLVVAQLACVRFWTW